MERCPLSKGDFMKILALLLGSLLAASAFAQQAPAKPATAPAAADTAKTAPEAKPDDVKSLDAIMKAIYDVISGPPGPRDWNRFQSLFIPEAHLIFSGKSKEGKSVHRAMSPTEYQAQAGGFFLKEGFFENSVVNKVDQFGTVAQVFSTYESRHEKGAQPFSRGINAIQLLNDGTRWWVVSILWDSERPDNPIPEKYLK
jgi:hypothetical protein